MGSKIRQFKNLLPSLANDPLIVIMTFIGTWWTTLDLFGFLDGPPVYGLCVLAFVLLWIVYHILRLYRISSYPPYPETPGVFFPFYDKDDEISLWPRDEEAKRLTKLIINSTDAHVLVSGPSGAGKSTLISHFVRPLLEKNNKEIYYFNSYTSFIEDILNINGLNASNKIDIRSAIDIYRKFISENNCSFSDAIDPTFQMHDADHVWSSIEPLIQKIYHNRDTVFVFDQVERVIHLLSPNQGDQSSNINGYDLYFFVRLIGLMRELQSTRTIFVLRSEYVFQSLELIDIVTDLKSGIHSSNISYFVCPGVNIISSPEAIDCIREDYRRISIMNNEYRTFEKILRIDSRTYSNTFMIQIIGFIIENYYYEDIRVQDYFNDRANREYFLALYFEYLIQNFEREVFGEWTAPTLKCVLFSVACENRINGKPCSLTRCAALMHQPPNRVQEGLEYLVKLMVLSVEWIDGEATYRLAHDRLSDHILESDYFVVDVQLSESIRSLVETGVSNESITHVSHFSHPIYDWFRAPNFQLFGLWLFYIIGLIALLFPRSIDFTSNIFSINVNNLDGIYHQYSYSMIYFVQFLWVTYIYLLNMNYLQKTIKSKYMKNICNSMTIIGSALGVYTIYNQWFFLLPILIVGIMLGLILIISSLCGEYKGRSYQNNQRWGWRTLFNMLFALSMVSIIWGLFFLRKNGSTELSALNLPTEIFGLPTLDFAILVTTGLMSLVMVWFWYHIYPEQQSEIGISARLAAYDRVAK